MASKRQLGLRQMEKGGSGQARSCAGLPRGAEHPLQGLGVGSDLSRAAPWGKVGDSHQDMRGENLHPNCCVCVDGGEENWEPEFLNWEPEFLNLEPQFLD